MDSLYSMGDDHSFRVGINLACVEWTLFICSMMPEMKHPLE